MEHQKVNKKQKHKTVYSSANNQAEDYKTAGNKNKGDAVYETSVLHSKGTGAWFDAFAYFPNGVTTFFIRGGSYSNAETSTFCFYHNGGYADNYFSFRSVLVS